MKIHIPIPCCRHFLMAVMLLIFSLNAMSQTKTRVTGAANWNTKATWIKPLPGLITTAFLSTGVLGLGTSFGSDLSVGDVICTTAGQEIGTIAGISGNTVSLTSFAAVLITLGGYGVEKVPTNTDDVEIGNTLLGSAVTVTLDAASATVNSLTFIADGYNNTLTHAGINALTVNNAVILQQPTTNAKTISWNINGGTATVNGNVNFSGINSNSRVAKIVITSGTLNANADIIFSGSTVTTKIIDMSGGAGSINLKGALTAPSSSATLTAGTAGSIFNYAGTGTQNINYFPAGKYYNLYVNNTSAAGASLTAAIGTSNVDGNLSVGNINTGSLFTTANYAIALNTAKTLTIAAGSALNAGTSVISFGTGAPNLTINGILRTANINGFSGSSITAINLTNPPTYLLGANSTIEYNAAGNQVVTGRADYANITVSGTGTKTANASITANNSLVIGSGTTFNAASFIHYMRGSLTSTGIFTSATSTMVFSGAGAQTIPGLTYNNLETSTGGTKTAAGTITVSNNLIIGGSTIFAAASFTHDIAGSFTNNGSFTPGSSTLNFNGSANQQISGTAHFNNLSVNNSNELIINNAITINGTLTLTNGRFNINGKTLTLDGGFSGNAANGLKGSVTSNLVISNSFSGSALYFDQTTATTNNYLKNFTLNNSASLGNELNIAPGLAPGSVNLSAGVTLTTNDKLTIRSNASGTAAIAEIPVDGAGVATAFLNGKVVIERYVPAGRGWRLLSTPVQTSGAPTINQAWQEGLTTASSNPNLYPGYGVKICGGSSANGYDTSSTINTFIKVFNSTTNAFAALPSATGTKIAISTYPAYFLYIRGDRSVDMLQGLSAAVTSTILRTRGQVITGKQDISVHNTNYSLLGNPYPSAIDFHTLTKNNVGDAFYAWDPQLAGTYGVGGYVSFIWNNSTHSYDATASVGNITQYIQSGSAVLIASADHTNAGTVSIKESDKTTLGNDPSARTNNTDQRLRVNLYMLTSDSTTALLDGVLTTYADDNVNSVDNDDAKKLYGSNQSINIRRDGKMLAIERRKTISGNDTCFLNLYQMKVQQYQLEIITQGMDNTCLQAVLKDNYASITNDVPLQMNGSSTMSFSVNSDPASYAVDRFKIVFEPLAPLPIHFKTVKAYQQENDIAVEWRTVNESTTRYYEVERSDDGREFKKISNSPVTATNTGSASYRFIDMNPIMGMNFYRIISVAAAGEKLQSNIVTVNMENEKTIPAFSIYPNPVTGNKINLKFNHLAAGTYSVQIFNNSGQRVSVKTIQYNAGNAGSFVNMNNVLPAGKYQVSVTGEQVSLQSQLIKK